MKAIFYSAIVLFSFLSFTSHAGTRDTLLTLADAKKIMGEPGHMTETKTTNEANSIMYRSVYMADTKDAPTGKLGNLYYIIEWYKDDSACHNEYMHIKNMNEKNGISTLKSIGDEAYFHTDKENFYFILARKGKKMFRMKVNKITSHTSQEAFMEVSRAIASKL